MILQSPGVRTLKMALATPFNTGFCRTSLAKGLFSTSQYEEREYLV